MSGKIDNTGDVSEGEEGMDEDMKQKHREEKEKKKMRGKNKSLKRYLRKKRKNVIDPAMVRGSFDLELRLISIALSLDCYSDEAREAEGGEKESTGSSSRQDRKETTICSRSFQPDSLTFHSFVQRLKAVIVSLSGLINLVTPIDGFLFLKQSSKHISLEL